MLTDDEIKEIYANAPIEKQMFQVISMHASWFSKKYYLQNMDTEDIEVLLEDGVTLVTAEYAPMSVSETGNNSDMDYSRNVTLQSLNDQIASEMENRDYESDEKVAVEARNYIIYRDGSISEMKGAVSKTLLSSVTRDEVGTTFATNTKSVTSQGTGEVVTVSRVPMIKGFI